MLPIYLLFAIIIDGTLQSKAMASFPETWNIIHDLWHNLKWLVSCPDDGRFSQEQITARKTNIANAIQRLTIDLDIPDDILIPDRDPGLAVMLDDDLGIPVERDARIVTMFPELLDTPLPPN